MNWLKAHWPTISAIAGGVLSFLLPSLQNYEAAHSKTLVSILLSAVIAAYYAKSPLKGSAK